jgi:hypothetical protein
MAKRTRPRDEDAYLIAAIQHLQDVLERKYGGNFSFQISGNHRLIAAHNYRPDITWSPTTYRKE